MNQVNDPAEREPVIQPMRVAPASGHEWPDPLPFRAAQPIRLIAPQHLLGSEALNRHSRRGGILVAYKPLEAQAP